MPEKRLYEAISAAFLQNNPSDRNPGTIELLLRAASFTETFFTDGDCGHVHGILCNYYSWAAIYAAECGDKASARSAVQRAFSHNRSLAALIHTGIHLHTSPAVSGIVYDTDLWLKTADLLMWKTFLIFCPDSFITELKQSPDYAPFLT